MFPILYLGTFLLHLCLKLLAGFSLFGIWKDKEQIQLKKKKSSTEGPFHPPNPFPTRH